MDILSSFVTSAKFTRHEFEEYVTPLVDADTEAASHDSAIQAIEAAHTLAFRHGLGHSLFAPSHNSLTVNDVVSFATLAFAKNNIAVLGTGIDQDTLNSLVNSAFSNVPSTSSVSSSPSKYFGGETRVQSSNGSQTVFIGYGITGAPSAEIAALAAYLSPNPSVKWSRGLSPLSSLPEGASGQVVYLPYSDATLFGILIQGSTAAAAKEAGKVAVAALKAVAQGIKAEELKSAIAKAKFTEANTFENKDGLVRAIGSRVRMLDESCVYVCQPIFARSFPVRNYHLTTHFHLWTEFQDLLCRKFVALAFYLRYLCLFIFLQQSAASLMSTKPTYVVVGESQTLPFADELGL